MPAQSTPTHDDIAALGAEADAPAPTVRQPSHPPDPLRVTSLAEVEREVERAAAELERAQACLRACSAKEWSARVALEAATKTLRQAILAEGQS